jgi:hypothetical protein
MNKNAYEIRFDVLALAREDLMSKFFQTLEAFRSTIVEEQKTDFLQAQLDVIGSFPSTEDILARAKELYAFVSDNSQQ